MKSIGRLVVNKNKLVFVMTKPNGFCPRLIKSKERFTLRDDYDGNITIKGEALKVL